MRSSTQSIAWINHFLFYQIPRTCYWPTLQNISVFQEDIKSHVTEALTLLSNSISAVLRICIDQKPNDCIEQDGEGRHQIISEPIARFITLIFSGFQQVGLAAAEQGIHFGIVNIAWKAVVTTLSGIAKAHPSLRQEASSFFLDAKGSGQQAAPSKQSNPWLTNGVTHSIRSLCHLTCRSILQGVQTGAKILSQSREESRDDDAVGRDLQRAFLLAKFFQNNAIRLALLYPEEAGDAAEAIVGLLIVYSGLLRKGTPGWVDSPGSTRLPPRLVVTTMASVLGPTVFALLNNLLLSDRLGDEKKQGLLRLCITGGGDRVGADGNGRDASQLVPVLLTQCKIDSLAAVFGACQGRGVAGDTSDDMDSTNSVLLAELTSCGQLFLSAVILHASPSLHHSLLATLLHGLPHVVDSLVAREEAFCPLLSPVLWPAANCSRFEGLEEKPTGDLSTVKPPGDARLTASNNAASRTGTAVVGAAQGGWQPSSGDGGSRTLSPARGSSRSGPPATPTLHSRLDRGMKMLACAIWKLGASKRPQAPASGDHQCIGVSKEQDASHLWRSYEQLLFRNLTNPHPLAAQLILSPWGFILRHADVELASRHLHVLISALRATVWKVHELGRLGSACGNQIELQPAASDPPLAFSRFRGSGPSASSSEAAAEQQAGAGVAVGAELRLLSRDPQALEAVVHHTAIAVTSLLVNLPPRLLYDAAIKPLLTALSSLTLTPQSAAPQRLPHPHTHTHSHTHSITHSNSYSYSNHSSHRVNSGAAHALPTTVHPALEAGESLCLLLHYGAAVRLLLRLPEAPPPIVRTCSSLSRSILHGLVQGMEGDAEQEYRMAAVSHLFNSIAAVLTAFR